MVLSKLETAIKERKKVSLMYKGVLRIIEPYLVGINTKGNESLRAYQIGGYSSSGNLPAWRLFLFEDIEDIEVLDDHFEINDKYNHNDRGMRSILFRV